MPFKTAFWKSLLGLNAQVLVAGAYVYTTQGTYTLFQANASQGELGIYNADTGALISSGGAVGSTVNIFIAIMRDSTINAVDRSTIFTVGNASLITRTAYSAPVKQIGTVTLGAVAAPVQDLLYGVVGGGGTAVTITYVVAGNNTPLSVSVTGNAITVNLSTNGGGTATATAAQVLAAIQASATAYALVSVSPYITANQSNVQAAQGVTSLGVAPVITAGNVYDLTIMDQTVGYQPMPSYEYQYVAQTGDTLDTIGAKLASYINSSSLYQNTNRDLIVTAAYVATTKTITVTAINYGVTFKLIARFALQPIAALTITTAMHLGSGFATQVQLMEQAGDIYKGVTTNYPMQGTNPADFGAPPSLVNTALGYNIYQFGDWKDERSKSPNKRFWAHRQIILAVPSTGNTPESAVKTIFGL